MNSFTPVRNMMKKKRRKITEITVVSQTSKSHLTGTDWKKIHKSGMLRVIANSFYPIRTTWHMNRIG